MLDDLVCKYGPVHRTIGPWRGAWGGPFVQSWKPFAWHMHMYAHAHTHVHAHTCTHMAYAWHMHGYPCICMAHAWIECIRMHHACTCMHRASCTCIMHMHASCNMLTHVTCSHACNMHRVRVFGFASICFVIQCMIDIICDQLFDDEQFKNIEGIKLSRNNGRDYDHNCCVFQDIPPHHIVIQGKFLRVIHTKMKDLKMTRLRCRLDVAGTFAIAKRRVWREVEHTLSSSSSSTSDDIEPDFIVVGPPGIFSCIRQAMNLFRAKVFVVLCERRGKIHTHV